MLVVVVVVVDESSLIELGILIATTGGTVIIKGNGDVLVEEVSKLTDVDVVLDGVKIFGNVIENKTTDVEVLLVVGFLGVNRFGSVILNIF